MIPSSPRRARPFETIHEAQLGVYASEFARLHRLLRLRINTWIQAEQNLRIRGTHAETIHQALAAAYTVSEIAGDEALPWDARAIAVGRLPAILRRGLAAMRDSRTKTESHPRDDLGLVALLRWELRKRASERGWDVDINVPDMKVRRLSTLSETAAYLSLCEALDFAIRDPETRQVCLTVATEANRLHIALTISAGSTKSGPAQISIRDGPTPITDAALLTRLYARCAGGTCSWEHIPITSGGTSGHRMVLVLPAGSGDIEAPPPPTDNS